MKFDISSDGIGLAHNNEFLPGTVIKWTGTDTEALFKKHCSNPRTHAVLKMHGWLDPECITYRYNKHGYRDEEFDDRPAGIALGCSYTEGIGIPEHNAWGNVLGTMLGMHVWNLGVGGGSLDTVVRLLDYWLPKLNLKFVAVCIPAVHRMEIFQSTNSKGFNRPVNVGPWPCPDPGVDEFYRTWIMHDANMIMLRRKNLLAIQQLCDQAKIPLVMKDENLMMKIFIQETGIEYTSPDTDIRYINTARDLGHPGVKNHEYFAQQIYKNLPTELKQ